MNPQYPSVTQGKPGGMWSTLTRGTTPPSSSTTTHRVTTQQPAPQSGIQTFSALRATTADANSVSYQQSTPLVYDARTFGHYHLSPRDRLSQAEQALSALNAGIGMPDGREQKQQTIKSVFQMLASLNDDPSSQQSALHRIQRARFEDLWNQCDQRLERKKLQRHIDHLLAEVVRPLEALHAIAAVNSGMPVHAMRRQWELAQALMQKGDYAGASRHLDAMGEIFSELPDGGIGQTPLLEAITKVTQACLNGQVPGDQVIDLQTQIDQLPDDAVTTAATTLQAPAAVSARPVAQPQTTAGDADIQWPEGHILPGLLAKLQSPELRNKSVTKKRAHLVNVEGIAYSTATRVLEVASESRDFQKAFASLCRNVQEPTQFDATPLARRQSLLDIYGYMQSMQAHRQDDGMIPRFATPGKSSASTIAGSWRNLIWGPANNAAANTLQSVKSQLEHAGADGIPLSGLAGTVPDIRAIVEVNGGTFIKWTDDGIERVALRVPPISPHEIRELILKTIDRLKLAQFNAADIGDLGLGLHHRCVTHNLDKLSNQTDPKIRQTPYLATYERIPDPTLPPAKRLRLA